MKEKVLNEFISCLKIEKSINVNSFSSKLMLLFGENNLLDIKQFFLIMELTSNSDDIIEKIKFIAELLSDSKLKNEENCINIAETFYLIKNIFNSSNYRKDIKYFFDILKKEFNNGNKIDNSIYTSKSRLINLFLKNKFLQRKIKEFNYKYENADINYDEQINIHFNSNARILNHFIFDEK